MREFSFWTGATEEACSAISYAVCWPKTYAALV